MEEYCREKGFAGWFETSAKENINIEEAARSLVNKVRTETMNFAQQISSWLTDGQNYKVQKCDFFVALKIISQTKNIFLEIPTK